MIKTKLIKLTDKFILVSDEKIKEGDWYWTPIKRSIEQCIRKLLIIKDGENDKEQFKIIAGIPELPSIDFSLLSEEDCKRIGWIDVEKLANNTIESYYGDKNAEIGSRERSYWETQIIGFIEGFKAA